MIRNAKILISVLLLFGSPTLGAESALQHESLAPPESPLYGLSREDQMRVLYEVVARNLRAAGHELTLEVRDVTTIPRGNFGLYKTHQIFTVGEGMALRVKPETSRTHVEMPDGTRREIDRFITFHLEWEPDYWLMTADPKRAALFERIRNQTFGEYVENGAPQDEALQHLEAVTSIEIQLVHSGRERVYRAAALWPKEGTTEWTFHLVDRVLLQWEDAFDPEVPVRPVSALTEVAEIPKELLAEITEKRAEDPDWEHSETQCKPFHRTFGDADFSQGFEEHSGGGEHQASADITFTCQCDTSCTSSCSPSFTFTNCEDFDPIAFGRQHAQATAQEKDNGTMPEAWDSGATCAGGFGCVFRSCAAGTSCSVSISVQVSGATVSFNSTNATYSLNSSFELQGGCPKCEVDTDNCLSLGGETLCGSDPEPIPEQDSCSEPSACSPIVIDLARDGFRFTGFDAWVSFDIDADGASERITWTEPSADEAFLVLDRNGNGRIDDGKELFGNVTEQPATEEPNGFLALAVFDDPAHGGNEDGVITGADEIFDSLRLWKDANQDAVSQPSELRGLREVGIDGIQLSYVTSKRRDRHRNTLRWTSFVQFEDRGHLAAADVIFVPVPEGID